MHKTTPVQRVPYKVTMQRMVMIRLEYYTLFL